MPKQHEDSADSGCSCWTVCCSVCLLHSLLASVHRLAPGPRPVLSRLRREPGLGHRSCRASSRVVDGGVDLSWNPISGVERSSAGNTTYPTPNSYQSYTFSMHSRRSCERTSPVSRLEARTIRSPSPMSALNTTLPMSGFPHDSSTRSTK